MTAPIDDRDERDDALLDRLGAGSEPASAEEAERRAPYERVLDLLGHLPQVRHARGWDDRLEQKWRAARAAERRRRALFVTGGGLMLAAAAVLLILFRRDPVPTARPDDGVKVAVFKTDGRPRGGPPKLDDRITARAPRTLPHAELRVYRDAQVLIRCSDAPPCRIAGDHIEVDVTLDQPGTYRIIAIASANEIPAPHGPNLDDDVLDARQTGASVLRSELFRIR